MTRMQAPPHSIVPNVTTWSTLMNAHLQHSKHHKLGGDGVYAVFERMLLSRVAPDSHTLCTAFSALIFGLRGNRAAGPLKIIELSRTWVNARTLDHHVAVCVLRALADAGSASDLDKFWAFCREKLGCTRAGWPGPSLKILSDLSQRLNGQGQWSRIAVLLASATPSAAHHPRH